MAARHRRLSRTSRWQRGLAVVPLAVLGAAWMVTVSSSTNADDASPEPGVQVGPAADGQATGRVVAISATPTATANGEGDVSSTSISSAAQAPSVAPAGSGRASSGGGVTTPGVSGVTSTTGPSDSSPPARSATRRTSAPPPATTSPVLQRLDDVAEATAYCAQNLPGDPTEQMVTACGERLVGATSSDAAHMLSGTLVEVLARLGLANLIPAAPPVGLPCLPLSCLY